MFFRSWFYVCKIASIALVLIVLGFLLPWQEIGVVLLAIGFACIVPVAIAGVFVGIAVCFFGLRTACPFCREPGEWISYTKNTLALDCQDCGLVYGNPAWHWKLRVLPCDQPDELVVATDDKPPVEIPQGPFFDRVDSFRRWQYVLSLLFTTAMGSVGVWVVVDSARKYGWEIFSNWGVLLFGVGFLGMFVPATAYLVIKLLWRPTWHTVIDERGITVNEKTRPWDEIATVYEKSSSRTTSYLCFRTNRFYGFERYVHLMPPLSGHEVEAALDKIEVFVTEQHPHVEV